jgi:hypothetical protein
LRKRRRVEKEPRCPRAKEEHKKENTETEELYEELI